MATANIPHRWAEVIKAWADGKTIQSRNLLSELRQEWSDWMDSDRLLHIDNPCYEWRIKPEQKTGWIAVYDKCIYANDKIMAGTSNLYENYASCKANAVESTPYHTIIQITYTKGEGL